MTSLFLVCAVVGGTVLLCQVVLTLLGLTGDMLDVDLGGELDADTDLAGDSFDLGQGEGPSGSDSLFGVLSFRTVVAALTFFGLSGLAAESTGAGTLTVLAVACAGGAAALYGVYWLMLALYRLRAEGTVRIRRTVGREAVVYLAIPGHHTGAGKIHINLQNRTMEYRAVTAGDALPTGTKVIVANVAASDTLEVEPALEPERIEHV